MISYGSAFRKNLATWTRHTEPILKVGVTPTCGFMWSTA